MAAAFFAAGPQLVVWYENTTRIHPAAWLQRFCANQLLMAHFAKFHKTHSAAPLQRSFGRTATDYVACKSHMNSFCCMAAPFLKPTRQLLAH